MKHYQGQILSKDFMETIANQGGFIDAKKGGLLLGNSHEFGGVIIVYQYGNDFEVMGEVEGWEFILNLESSVKYRKRIGDINNITRDCYGDFREFKPSASTKIIDARSKPFHNKYILCDYRGDFAIINKYSTQKHIEELNIINAEGLAINNEEPYELNGLTLENFNEVKPKPWYKRIFRL